MFHSLYSQATLPRWYSDLTLSFSFNTCCRNAPTSLWTSVVYLREDIVSRICWWFVRSMLTRFLNLSSVRSFLLVSLNIVGIDFGLRYIFLLRTISQSGEKWRRQTRWLDRYCHRSFLALSYLLLCSLIMSFHISNSCGSEGNLQETNST